MTLAKQLIPLINDSHRRTWDSFDKVKGDAKHYGLDEAKVLKWKDPGEPAFVSNLVEALMSQGSLSSVIETCLKPTPLDVGSPFVSGVFIHQKPKVRVRGLRSNFELGDLLIVRQHFSAGNARPEGRALLMQAKKGRNPCTGGLRGSEARQFGLYANWNTDFKFPFGEIGIPPDGGDWWNFAKGPMPSHEESGIYGLVSSARTDRIGADFPAGCSWAVGRAIDQAGKMARVQSTTSLADVIEGMLLGTCGREWDCDPVGDDHWSHFVSEILEAALAWKYPVQRLGGRDLPRRRDALRFASGFSRRAVDLADELIDGPKTLMPARASEMRAAALEAFLNVGIRAEVWRSSLAAGSGAEPPASDRGTNELVPRPGGMSVLYVARFGDRSAGQSDRPPEVGGPRLRRMGV